MDALTVCWITTASVTALAALGGCVWVVRSSRQEPHSMDGYGFAAFFMLGIAALGLLGVGLGRAAGTWATAGILAVNALLQPFCLYLFAACAYKLALALAGRVVYAWRVVPQGEIPPAEYRMVRWYFILQGIVGCLFAFGLSWGCLGLL
jgi:hypothetical protein